MSLVRHTLSNIVLPTQSDPLGGWELFCKPDADGAEALQVVDEGIAFLGELDLFTYFNACSLEKWKRYAGVDTVFLELAIDDPNCVFQWVGRSEKDRETVALGSGSRISHYSSEIREDGSFFQIALPETDKQVVGFTLQSRVGATVAGGRYCAMVDEASINEVVLGLCTTTFQKEDYIIPNIDLVKNEIIACDDPIAQNFEMFVVDNGRTLDVNALTTERVHIVPNENTGGAGGFTRGMMEAIASDAGITHILLMDDDVSISTESIKRTFNLLSLARGKYEDAFINGAMLTLDTPNRQYEDISYVRHSGGYHKVKPDLLVDRAEDIVANEAINVEVPNAYGAWWFNCIPVKRIKEIGLPLPLFIRCDDVDYGLRAKPIYMTMNGICVWHEAFGGRFRASVDCYQYVRNYLISIACDNIASEKLFMARVARDIHFNMRFMAYDTVELLLDAVEDYLKGPEFIMQPNGAAIMREKGAKNEMMVPIEEIGEPGLVEVVDRYARGDKPGSPIGMFIKVWRTLPYDRHLLPDELLHDRRGKAIYTSSADFAWDALGTKSIVAVDHHGRMAKVRTMDRDRYRALMARWKELKHEYKQHGSEVRRAYRAAQPLLTSWDFWEEYLGIEPSAKG